MICIYFLFFLGFEIYFFFLCFFPHNSLTRQMEAYSLNVVNDTVSMVQRSVAVEKRTLSARNQNGIQFMSLKGLVDEYYIEDTCILNVCDIPKHTK